VRRRGLLEWAEIEIVQDLAALGVLAFQA